MTANKTRVYTDRKGWQKKVAELMKRRDTFAIVTTDPDFIPGDSDMVSASKWILGDGPAIAGGGAMVAVGAGMIILAFVDPEPTTTLMGMVLGGTVLVMTGGSYLFSIAVMRRKYRFKLSSSSGGNFEWEATPAG